MKSDRISQTAKKIEDFSLVQSGWHYGEGKTPKPEIITMALTLNDELSKAGFARTNAFLGLDGEIRVTAYDDAIYFELTIEPNEQITFLLEKNDKEMRYDENLSLNKALQYINEWREIAWSSSALSTSTTTIPTKNASPALPLSHQATAVEFP
jgi:hypothetical protein